MANRRAIAHTFTGLPGERYTFRVTATDHVGNAATAERVVALVQITKYYYHGGQRVALRQGQALYFLHPDHLGSTSLTTDAVGNVVARRRYALYGKERWAAGTLPTDFGFTGQRDVPGTGLMYYRARYYDPVLGRFVSADTVVPSPGDPQSLNRYAYALNNPLKYTDSDGHNPLLIVALALGVAVSAGYFSEHYEGLGYWALAVTSPAITEDPNGDRVAPPASGEVATSWLIGQMKANAQSEVTRLIRENWQGGFVQMAGASAGWNALVRTGAIWDFKVDLLEADIKTVHLGGQDFNYQAVANIHYGFVGRAAGIGADILRGGAGAAQLKWLLSGNSEAVGPLAYQNDAGEWRMSFYDQPFDAWWVAFGIFLYEQYGANLDRLTEESFAQSLKQFTGDYGDLPPLD